jgi:hypothetical protein
MLLSSVAWAEIYKTTDEEGNTVFTDVPPTEQSEVVDLPEANIADSVEPAPRPAAEEPPAKPPPGELRGQGAVYDEEDDDPYIYSDDPDLLEAKRAKERREKVIGDDGRHEGPKAPTPHRAPPVHRR